MSGGDSGGDGDPENAGDPESASDPEESGDPASAGRPDTAYVYVAAGSEAERQHLMRAAVDHAERKGYRLLGSFVENRSGGDEFRALLTAVEGRLAEIGRAPLVLMPRFAGGRFRQWLHRLLTGDPQRAEDIADAVLFLSADDSRMITKQMLTVDGGAASQRELSLIAGSHWVSAISAGAAPWGARPRGRSPPVVPAPCRRVPGAARKAVHAVWSSTPARLPRQGLTVPAGEPHLSRRGRYAKP